MKIDFSQTLKDFDGKSLADYSTDQYGRKVTFVDDAGAAIELTLKRVSINALMKEEQGMKADEKIRRNMLAEKIFAADEALDLQAEDVTLLKKLIDQGVYGQNPRVLAESWRLLDPPAQEE